MSWYTYHIAGNGQFRGESWKTPPWATIFQQISIIKHRLELKYFHFAKNLLNAHRSSSTSLKWELRTWNLGQNFEIKFWMVGQEHSRWSFSKADCSQTLQIKVEARPVNPGLYKPFKHHFSFAADLAANFGCDWLRIIPDIVSKHLHIANCSSCAVQLKYVHTPFSRTGRWFRSAALHRIRFRTCCFFLIFFAQKPMNDLKFERSNEHGLVGNNFSSITSKISFHIKKFLQPEIYTALKLFLNLEQSQHRKSGSTISSSEPVAACSDCSRLGNALCLSRPSDPPKLCRSAAPRAKPLLFQSNPLITFCDSLANLGLGEIARWPAGLERELCRLTNGF